MQANMVNPVGDLYKAPELVPMAENNNAEHG